MKGKQATGNPEYFVRMFIFVYFVRGGFRTKIKCVRKLKSKSEHAGNLQSPATVRKFHAYGKVGEPRIRKLSVYEIFWIYSMYM